MPRLIFFLMLMLPTASMADFAIDIHGLSHHFDDGHYNEQNTGIGLAYGGDSIRGIAGFYKNSFNERSTYAGAELMSSGYVRFGLSAGLVYGYTRTTRHNVSARFYLDGEEQYAPATVTLIEPTYRPMVMPFVEVGDMFCLRIAVMPGTEYNPVTGTLSLRIYTSI